MGACCAVGSCGKVLAGALALAAVGLGAGAVHSFFQPVEVSLPAGPVNGNAPPSAPDPDPGAAGDADPAAAQGDPAAPPAAAADPASLPPIITIAQARALHERGVIFVDARTPAEFEAGHVPAAFLLSMEDWDKPQTKDTLDFLVGFQNDPIVIYCKSPQCDASENLAILLRQAGFTRLHVMKEGYEAWVAAGLPTQTGKE